MSQPTERPASPFAEVTRVQWLVLIIASAGWVFDVYEGQLFTVFKNNAFAEVLGYSPEHARTDRVARATVDRHSNLANAFFLAGGAIGGLAFGILGDRWGRVRVMSLTILTYSVFSALTYFATAVWHLHALRFLVALGVGGEWAVAATLVSESFPARARTSASGIFHASSVLGTALASITGMLLSGAGDWRVAFLIGLSPALLVVAVRVFLREPDREKSRIDSTKAGSLGELLGNPSWRSRALLGLGLASIGLASFWGIFTWVPELVEDVLGKSVSPAEAGRAKSFVYLFMNCTGGLAGLLCFAPIASRKGRRFAFAFYHAGALLAAPATFLFVQSYNQVLICVPVMAFFVLGMHAGYAIYFPELFPASLRATGSSFCFNVGRLASGLLLLVRGEIREAVGLRGAVALTSCLFLAGLLLLIRAPETRGEPLPE